MTVAEGSVNIELSRAISLIGGLASMDTSASSDLPFGAIVAVANGSEDLDPNNFMGYQNALKHIADYHKEIKYRRKRNGHAFTPVTVAPAAPFEVEVKRVQNLLLTPDGAAPSTSSAANGHRETTSQSLIEVIIPEAVLEKEKRMEAAKKANVKSTPEVVEVKDDNEDDYSSPKKRRAWESHLKNWALKKINDKDEKKQREKLIALNNLKDTLAAAADEKRLGEMSKSSGCDNAILEKQLQKLHRVTVTAKVGTKQYQEQVFQHIREQRRLGIHQQRMQLQHELLDNLISAQQRQDSKESKAKMKAPPSLQAKHGNVVESGVGPNQAKKRRYSLDNPPPLVAFSNPSGATHPLKKTDTTLNEAQKRPGLTIEANTSALTRSTSVRRHPDNLSSMFGYQSKTCMPSPTTLTSSGFQGPKSFEPSSLAYMQGHRENRAKLAVSYPHEYQEKYPASNTPSGMARKVDQSLPLSRISRQTDPAQPSMELGVEIPDLDKLTDQQRKTCQLLSAAAATAAVASAQKTANAGATKTGAATTPSKTAASAVLSKTQ